ncbi:MAG: hypothetical protein P1U88_01170 [Thalassobaculaceae bacterium]|nr:hypothetical protein [Thalassobaculaceae bacterium]
MTAFPWSIEEVLPHSGGMVLLDAVVDVGDTWARTSVRIGEDSLFFEPGSGVPGWVGIEYMAQTIALIFGVQSRRAGEDVRIGMLLGTRRYEADVAYFPLGLELQVHVAEAWQDGTMAVFDCGIENEAGSRLATARVNVYRSDMTLAG